MKQALIIFVRNPALGNVKTRLAKTVGDEKALQVYNKLLQHTNSITRSSDAHRFVFYAGHINKNDCWENDLYEKRLQQGADLGIRMYNAFEEIYAKGYTRIVIIGSDCFELTDSIIEEAFIQLNHYDMLIGPAYDGGYYLLGFKKVYKDFFEGKKWGTPGILKTAISDADKLGLNYFLLPFLNDIDDEEDLLKSNMVI